MNGFKEIAGNSLEVQWLGLQAFSARTWVQSLVWELRSNELRSVAKKKERKKERKEMACYFEFRKSVYEGFVRSPNPKQLPYSDQKSIFQSLYLKTEAMYTSSHPCPYLLSLNGQTQKYQSGWESLSLKIYCNQVKVQSFQN